MSRVGIIPKLKVRVRDVLTPEEYKDYICGSGRMRIWRYFFTKKQTEKR